MPQLKRNMEPPYRQPRSYIWWQATQGVRVMDNGRDIKTGSMPTDHPERLSSDQIRQGTTGHNVRYVLAISLIAAIVLLLAVYWWLR